MTAIGYVGRCTVINIVDIERCAKRICISLAIARSLLEISKSVLLQGANVIPAHAAVESMVTLRFETTPK